MIELPWRPRKVEPECEIAISEVKFIDGLTKQIEVIVENLGSKNCTMKDSIQIKPISSPNWIEVQTTWDPAVLPPGHTSRAYIKYEWAKGIEYFIKVTAKEEAEASTLERARLNKNPNLPRRS
jgi:hypothetical protein